MINNYTIAAMRFVVKSLTRSTLLYMHYRRQTVIQHEIIMATTHTSTLTRKGQTTIPAEFRELLGLQAGDRLTWRIENGQLHVMSAEGYVHRMIEEFEAQVAPDRPVLSDEELRRASSEAWAPRNSVTVVQR